MIALGGPKLKPIAQEADDAVRKVSMIALGGPKLKLKKAMPLPVVSPDVSMIALGGPKLKLHKRTISSHYCLSFNDSTGWA